MICSQGYIEEEWTLVASGIIFMQTARSTVSSASCGRRVLSNLRFFAVLLAMLLSGCQKAADRRSDFRIRTAQPIKVLATVGMVADLVKQIGGEHISVKQLMGPGVDPHLYKATRDDMQQIMSADIVFSSGLMLEGRLEDTLNKVGEKRPVFAITSRLPAEMLLVAGWCGRAS